MYVKQVGDQENMELCDFSTDGKFVATVSPGSSEIILWNAEKALAEERTLSGHSKPVTALSFSSDGRFLVTTAQVLPRVFQTLCPDPREELYNSTGDIANVIPISLFTFVGHTTGSTVQP